MSGKPTRNIRPVLHNVNVMPTELSPRLMSWASEVDDVTINQAFRTAALPIIAGHVALMPDAYLGIGSTVGSVIPTDGAVIPSAVGVDIGCGMIAAELDFTASQLPDDLTLLLHCIGTVVPAGLARGHRGRDVVATTTKQRAKAWFNAHEPATELGKDQRSKAVEQFGSLGSGNHFLEVCIDERDHVWIMLHSGSRGIGNQLAQGHISRARKLAKHLDASLRDPDLACFLQGTAEFDAYLADMLGAQDYALANREQMITRVAERRSGDVAGGCS